MDKKVVLITGASRGLGLAILREFANDSSFHLIATARFDSLHRFVEAGIVETDSLWIRPLDVLKKSDRDLVLKEADSIGGVDILVNNAGYMLRAVVEHVGEMERFRQMDTNFRAPMALIRGVLAGMREKRSGHIINISSVGGMMAMPTMAVYNASKYALEGATEALWYEVRPWNIRVTLVQPGFINSDSFEQVKMTRESQKSFADKNDAYFHHYNSMTPFIAKLMRMSPASAETVAKRVFKVAKIRDKRLRVSGTIDAHIFHIIRKILPRSIYNWVLYYSLPKIGRWGE